MSDVFISYSRQDTDFVRKLFNALEATGRDAWVDWEGIPYSVDWWQEICRGIDASDVFIFAVTPSSLTSHICNQELEYARANHKRIVPVMHIEPEEKYLAGEWFNQEWEQLARTNWDELKKINWLYFRVEDDFDKAFQELIKAVEVDPEHLRFHTRLLVRAREWENSEQRNPELLLRGEELRRAENWLQFNSDKNPPPTSTHRQYIERSLTAEAERLEIEQQRQQRELEMQRRAANRLRLFAISLVVFLIAAIGLAIFAFGQQDRAEESESQAQTQAAIADVQAQTAIAAQATSDRQADLSRSILWSNAAGDALAVQDYDLALPFILAANRIENPPLIARDLLAQARYSPGRIGRLGQYHTANVHSVAISADRLFVLSGSADRTVILWDFETGKALHTFTGHTDAVNSVAISRDGHLAMSGSCAERIFDVYRTCVAGELIVWDLEAEKALYTLGGHRGYVTDIAISPDSHTALSSSSDDTLILWDLQRGEQLQTLSGHTDRVNSVAFSGDGQFAVSGACGEHDEELDNCISSELIVWDLENLEQVRTLTGHRDTVNGVAISSDGRRAVSGACAERHEEFNYCTSSELIVWDLTTGDIEKTLYGHTDTITSVALSDDGHVAVSGSWDNTVIVWNIETGEEINVLFGNLSEVNDVAISPDGQFALSGSSDNSLILWNAQTGQLMHTFAGHTNTVTDTAISLDGRFAVSSSCGEYNFTLLDCNSGRLIVWDFATGKRLHTLSGHSNTINSVAISPDGRLTVTGSSDHTLIQWDLETGEALRTLTGHLDSVNDVAISQDSRYIVSGSSDSSLIIWSLETGEQLLLLAGYTGEVTDVAISPDGRFALSSSSDDRLVVWDLDTGEPMYNLDGHSFAVRDVAISPDSRFALSGSCAERDNIRLCSEGEIIAWDLMTGEPLYTLTGHTDWVTALAITPDSRFALSGS